MKIIVDMDEVICEGGFLSLINKFLNTSYKEDDFSEFYMQDIIENKEKFFEFFLEHNLYDYGVLIENAVDVLKKLNDVYEVFICTDYIFPEIVDQSGIILKYKFDYLRKHLPFINPRNFIFTSNKSVVVGDIKIDDRLVNLEGVNRKLLFTAYHNRSISDEVLIKQGVERVNGWNDILAKLIRND